MQAPSMRAVVAEAFGEADVLRMRAWPAPQAGPGEVVIAVRYAGVNFADIMSRRAGYLGVRPPFVPGMEVAGTVAQVGDGTVGLAVGDRVCAMTMTGGYSELVAADAATVFPADERLGWPVAAALPLIVPTAHALLHELGRIRARDAVLVNAAAGGTGLVLGQMARAARAHAAGIVSTPEKAATAREHGYELVFTTAEVAAGALEHRRFDLVLDSVGGPARAAGWEALAPFGTLIAYGNASAAPEPPVTPAELRRRNQRAAGFSITALARERPELLAAIAERSFALVADGSVRVAVEDVLPLHRAADAHRALEGRRTVGKTVLEVAA